MDWKTVDSQFTEVNVAGPASERVTECTICWSLVVDSSKKLHLEYHVRRKEFDSNES